MLKIKVLETEEFEFEGERFSIPVKVEINGREYDVKWENDFGEIHELNVEDLKELRLEDIPENLGLNCESTDIGWLRLQQGYASLEISDHPKYWRGNISIDNYFKLLKNFALKSGFEVVGEVEDDNLYMVMFGKEFPKETEIGKIYDVFKRLVDKINNVEKIVDALVKGLLSIISVEQSSINPAS